MKKIQAIFKKIRLKIIDSICLKLFSKDYAQINKILFHTKALNIEEINDSQILFLNKVFKSLDLDETFKKSIDKSSLESTQFLEDLSYRIQSLRPSLFEEETFNFINDFQENLVSVKSSKNTDVKTFQSFVKTIYQVNADNRKLELITDFVSNIDHYDLNSTWKTLKEISDIFPLKKISSKQKKNLLDQLSALSKELVLDFSTIYFNQRSYSQEGEDLILESMLVEDKIETGIYVDIGAFHPLRFSNTEFFYRKGWRGINIEPFSDNYKLFTQLRPEDQNLNLGIGESESIKSLQIFDEPALNSFDKSHTDLIEKETQYKVIGEQEIKVTPLRKVLAESMNMSEQITFFNIDTECNDLQVLHSNDWARFKPRYILIEMIQNEENFDNNKQINEFLIKLHYSLVAQTHRTGIYKLNAVKLHS
ncbi:hypothetical protein GF357_00510 [Candidatus Dojkabacteria bacterium]|nr:hypothetical protein [Candidatus Dojkabacteria bacterium]